MLILYNDSGKPEFPLKEIENFYITHKYGGFDTLSFDIYTNHDLYGRIVEEVNVEYGDNVYAVKKINERGSISTVECALDLDIFRKDFHRTFTSTTATVNSTLARILPPGWSLIDKAYITLKRSIEIENALDMDVLEECMDVYKCVYEFNIKKKWITIINPGVADKLGAYFTDELNMTDLSFKGSTDGYITRLYPYGKDGMTIADVNGGREYVEDFTYSNKVVCGFWKDERYTVKESLKADAIENLKAMAYPVRSYQCTVKDLASLSDDYIFLKIRMYMSATLVDRHRGTRVDHQVVEYKEYPEESAKNVVTLSTTAPKLESQIKKIQIDAEKGSESLKGEFQGVIEDMTNAITGNSGGCILHDPPQNPERILIMDNADKTKAMNVWQFNQAGFGHSSNGINGPYEIAITADGRIVADFILAGVLKGIQIENADGTVVIDSAGQLIFKDAATMLSAMTITKSGIYIPRDDRIDVHPYIQINGKITHTKVNSSGTTTTTGTRSCILSAGGLRWEYRPDNGSGVSSGAYISSMSMTWYTLAPGSYLDLEPMDYITDADFTSKVHLVPIIYGQSTSSGWTSVVLTMLSGGRLRVRNDGSVSTPNATVVVYAFR